METVRVWKCKLKSGQKFNFASQELRKFFCEKGMFQISSLLILLKLQASYWRCYCSAFKHKFMQIPRSHTVST